MNWTSMMPPPEVFSLPIVRCPACLHGIDPHGVDPGGQCGMGNVNGRLCRCLWSPNDIAAYWRADLYLKVEALSDEDPCDCLRCRTLVRVMTLIDNAEKT